MTDNHRKRSRWGGPPPPHHHHHHHQAPHHQVSTNHNHNHNHHNHNHNNHNNHNNHQPSSVSDQDALLALLSSADSRQREREEQLAPHNHHPRKKPRGGRDQDKRGRFDRNDTDDRRRRNDRNRNDNSSQQQQQQQGMSRRSDDNYYGPAAGGANDNAERRNEQYGARIDDNNNNNNDVDDDGKSNSDGEPKQKPNFGLSGALTKDEEKGNVYKGVVLKFSEPAEARAPNTQWRLYVFKGDETLETLHIAKQSAYLFGRNEDISDIKLLHASCSSQHAVLQYRAVPNPHNGGKLQCSPYLMDLESTNGSFLNGIKIDSARYYQLKKGDVLKFGASTREYVLLTANTTSIE